MKVSPYRVFNRWLAMRNLHRRQLTIRSFVGAIIASLTQATALAEPYEPQLGSKIDSYLWREHSPIGDGAVFFSQGVQWDVDPRLIVAIAGAESSFGTRWVDCQQIHFNAWSWFWGGTCPTSPFASYADGINTVTKFMRLAYFNHGQTTIPLIQSGTAANPGHQYCAKNCSNWIKNVTNSYKSDQGGDTSDLTFAIGFIDFEQFATGASDKFTAIQPPLLVYTELNGQVSNNIANSATISGGQILDAATHLPVDRSVVYGTSSFCSGCLPAITIQFANKVSNFSLFLINGATVTLTYTVEDDQGGIQKRTLVSNLASGSSTVVLPEAGIRQVTVTSNGGNAWDFFVDNIRFTPS
jgi:hypothetical protein